MSARNHTVFVWWTGTPERMKEFWKQHENEYGDWVYSVFFEGFHLRFRVNENAGSLYTCCSLEKNQSGLIFNLPILMLPERSSHLVQNWVRETLEGFSFEEPGLVDRVLLRCWKRAPSELTQGTPLISFMRKARVLEE